MSYWTSDLEREVVLRLAAGDRWRMESKEKSAVVQGWNQEPRPVRNMALDALYKAKKKVTALDAPSVREMPHRMCHGYAHVCGLFSARWDIWELCLDRAAAPPTDLTDTQKNAYSHVYRVLATQARCRPPLQRSVITSQPIVNDTNTTPHTAPYIAIDHDTHIHMTHAVEVLDTQEQAVAVARELARTLGDMAAEDYGDFAWHVANAKHALRLELQEGGKERDGEYWLPISVTDVRHHRKMSRYLGPNQPK